MRCTKIVEIAKKDETPAAIAENAGNDIEKPGVSRSR
jgi:hypothetical protein